jgi:hypothetical protein
MWTCCVRGVNGPNFAYHDLDRGRYCARGGTGSRAGHVSVEAQAIAQADTLSCVPDLDLAFYKIKLHQITDTFVEMKGVGLAKIVSKSHCPA